MKWNSRKSTMVRVQDRSLWRVWFAQLSLWSQPLLLSQALTLSLNACVSFQHIGAEVMLIVCRKCSEERKKQSWFLWGPSFLLWLYLFSSYKTSKCSHSISPEWLSQERDQEVTKLAVFLGWEESLMTPSQSLCYFFSPPRTGQWPHKTGVSTMASPIWFLFTCRNHFTYKHLLFPNIEVSSVG